MTIGYEISQSIEEVLGTIATNLQAEVENIWKLIWQWLNQGIIGAISQAVAWAEGIYNALYDFAWRFGSYFYDAFNSLGSWIESGLNWIRQGLENAYNYVAGGIQALGDYIRAGLESIAGWFNAAWNWLAEQVYNFGNWIYNGVKWLADTLWGAITSIYNFFSNLFGQLSTIIKNWFSGVVDTLNTVWTNIVLNIRNKIVETVTANAVVILTWKGIERFGEIQSVTDFITPFAMMLSAPVVGFLAGSIIDATLPKPSATAKHDVIPVISIPEFTIPEYTPPSLTEPTPPDKGQPYEPVAVLPTYSGDAKAMVLDTQPTQVGALGTRIRSVTVKAHLGNTAPIWLAFTSDMTPDNVFVLNPGESVDLAVDDLGKIWLRAEEGTQIAYVVWVRPETG